MRHTPGPWKVGGGRAINAKAFDGSWKWVCDKVRGGSPEEAEANAALIAAAPDMIKSLECIAETLDKMAPCPEEILDQLMAEAQSAIKQAKAVNYAP